MDERMDDADPEAIGPLWIRRLVFEHSVAVPFLTIAKASQIDFARLAEELLAANVNADRATPPAVTYDAWVAAAGLHARLDSSEDAGIIIEALETNAPDAFVKCNNPENLAPGRQLNYRCLRIPVPELLAFLRLHAAATIASRFREQADAVWPDADQAIVQQSGSAPTSPMPVMSDAGSRTQSQALQSLSLSQTSSPRASPSPSPVSPRLSQSHPPSSQGSPHTQSPGPPSSPGIDGIVRKKTPTHLGSMIQSQSAIIASVQHAFQRETRLVVSNLKTLLLTIASSYGLVPTSNMSMDVVQHESGIVMGGGTVAVESGTLDRQNHHGSLRRANSLGSGQRTSSIEEGSKNSAKSLPITRQMFEHMAFLLTTTCGPSGLYRPVSWVVPQWRDTAEPRAIPLGELVDTVTDAITRIPLLRDMDGSTDVVEIRDIDRKTILRTSIPTTNASVTGYPHAKEIRISNCSDCHFYLLASLGRVSFIACRDCTVFIGACVSASLINCVNVRLHAIARVCRVTNCFDTHLYLCTNRNPQVVGENRGLMFAPYNAAYSKSELQKHLAAVGVDPDANVWDKFYRPAFRSTSMIDRKDPDLTPAVATILPPERFLPFGVPVRSSKPTKSDENNAMPTEKETDLERDAITRMLFTIPVPIPEAYQEQLDKNRSEIFKFRAEIRKMEKKHAALNQTQSEGRGEISDNKNDVPMSDSTSLSPNPMSEEQQGNPSPTKKTLFQFMVNQRFREWLTSSGKIRQLNDLVRLEEVQR
ncbi:TBCC domain-containing protein 1 [Gracilariopsis chorda]|uniref:TBCC domain-containing protein 1 n=1 Tax=Gracilariopsis chorda TaxID=448386 RepID=A0A2V3J596_9FLOR|nr:TBCC domain-containing protein 1 [Gracilariopsis chorda]|eukprot:PXF48550.1 TBCC domain-containing protein 1 [Gracilariopsis chorda]